MSPHVDVMRRVMLLPSIGALGKRDDPWHRRAIPILFSCPSRSSHFTVASSDQSPDGFDIHLPPPSLCRFWCTTPFMPRRSSGCFTCRARKVRCDEAKPECNTCLRRGTKCPGYRPTQSFILHTFDERSERPGIVKENEDVYRYANKAKEEASGSQQSVVQPRTPGAVLASTSVPPQVSPVAIDRVQHLSNFLSLYLPKWKGEVMTPPSDLILSLPNTPASRQVFLSALDAVSAAQLAVDNKNYPLINRSRSLYSTALSQLMRSITQSGSAHEDETLLATYLLALYEVTR